MDEFALNDHVNEGSMLAKLALDRADGVEAVVCSNNEVDDRCLPHPLTDSLPYILAHLLTHLLTHTLA